MKGKKKKTRQVSSEEEEGKLDKAPPKKARGTTSIERLEKQVHEMQERIKKTLHEMQERIDSQVNTMSNKDKKICFDSLKTTLQQIMVYSSCKEKKAYFHSHKKALQKMMDSLCHNSSTYQEEDTSDEEMYAGHVW